jgi:hypothetical protein
MTGSTLPQPNTMSPIELAFDETTSHPSATSSLIGFSVSDQSIDCPPRVVLDIFEKILYSNCTIFVTPLKPPQIGTWCEAPSFTLRRRLS